MKNVHPTPQELAEEAREAMRRLPLGPSGEEFDRLVELGWINAKGQLTKLLGGDAEPEAPTPGLNGTAKPTEEK